MAGSVPLCCNGDLGRATPWPAARRGRSGAQTRTPAPSSQRTSADSPAMTPAKTPLDLQRLGGEDGIARWVRRFYEKVAADAVLAPLFTDLERARSRQVDYFVEIFGGPKRYTERYGKAFLRFKHRTFRIGQPERDAWMRLVLESLGEVGADAAVVAEVERRLAPIADAMVNHHPQRQDAYYFQR